MVFSFKKMYFNHDFSPFSKYLTIKRQKFEKKLSNRFNQVKGFPKWLKKAKKAQKCQTKTF